MRGLLIFAAGMVAAGALNQARWAIWPISGGPTVGGPNGPAIFGWLGGPPGYGRPTGPVIHTTTR